MGGLTLEAGSIVARGKYWNAMGRASRWYTPQPELQAEEKLFRVKWISRGNVGMEDPSPPTVALTNRRDKARIMAMRPKRIVKEEFWEVVYVT